MYRFEMMRKFIEDQSIVIYTAKCQEWYNSSIRSYQRFKENQTTSKRTVFQFTITLSLFALPARLSLPELSLIGQHKPNK